MKNLIISAVIAAVLGVSGSALADCDAHEYLDARDGLAFCHEKSAYVAFDRDNGWQTICETADGREVDLFTLAEERCDEAAFGWREMGIPESSVGGQMGMYEACMRLETNSPIPLGDGSFWR